jgi:aarF domain-containing kinase
VEALKFGLGLLSDLAGGKLKSNEPLRARQLRGAIERLGPAYVKVAQALSTRVDLLSPQYFEQIQLLQDRVPPFSDVEAKAVMEQVGLVGLVHGQHGCMVAAALLLGCCMLLRCCRAAWLHGCCVAGAAT